LRILYNLKDWERCRIAADFLKARMAGMPGGRMRAAAISIVVVSEGILWGIGVGTKMLAAKSFASFRSLFPIPVGRCTAFEDTEGKITLRPSRLDAMYRAYSARLREIKLKNEQERKGERERRKLRKLFSKKTMGKFAAGERRGPRRARRPYGPRRDAMGRQLAQLLDRQENGNVCQSKKRSGREKDKIGNPSQIPVRA